MSVRSVLAALAVTSMSISLAACGGSLDKPENAGSGDGTTVKVGYISPLTGPLAAFGEGDQYVVDEMTAYFKDNPIEAGGKSYTVEILLKDSQSDPKRAGEVAADLINNDGVNVLMAHATPETTVPVAQQCEANGIPCITADTPWQPWVAGLGANPGDPATALKWSHHFFWGLEDITAVEMDIWSQVDTNKHVGAFFANDADGQAFTDPKLGQPAIVEPAGFSYDNPGLYPAGTQVFSAQISQFKKNDDQILDSIAAPPDFAAFYQQAKQQGYAPKIVTAGKAIEFPAAVAGLGDLAENLATEVWWAPTYPTSSSLTGLTSQQFADNYEKASGKQWNVTLGFSESLFEVMAQAVTDAGGTDPQAVNDAVAGMKLDTLVGTLDWTSGPFPNIAKTPLTGGQWRKDADGTFQLVIVSNSHAKEMGLDVPLGGEVEPTN
jgi:branched-chain amino acid transport system substrate-binding protein